MSAGDDNNQNGSPEAAGESAGGENDIRLYVPHAEGWTAHVKPTSEREYCYFKSPGEDHFHLLMMGEIYLERNGEKSCLNCALRHGGVSRDRMHWKRSQG